LLIEGRLAVIEADALTAMEALVERGFTLLELMADHDRRLDDLPGRI
jgi:hypothetical protein